MTTTLEKLTPQSTVVASLPDQASLAEPTPSEEPTRWRWTRADYHRAGELGLFSPDERLELINGEVWKQMSPQGAPHAFSVGNIADVLREAFATGFHIREEKPLILNDLTEPEPDIVVVRGTRRQFRDHPTSAEAALVVEVSETTLKFDQIDKSEAYARSGIADYWVLNQRARQLEVRREPGLLGEDQWGYRSLRIIPEDGQVSPLAAPEIVINIADLLPANTADALADTPDNSEMRTSAYAPVEAGQPQNAEEQAQ